jgi:hypothetical protein
MPKPIRTHVVAGGFPPGKTAGHDIDYARLRILESLQANENVHATVGNDFVDCEKWIRDCQLLVTYVSGPYADDHTTGVIRDWLSEGGRWLALHGSSGGKAARIEGSDRRRMVKMPYHEALGGFFVTHPPVREIEVHVADRSHVLTHNLPASFTIQDEPYWIEVLHPETQVLLTMEMPENPDPGYAMTYDEDTSLLADGKSRALGFVRSVGNGGVAYIAPGHCHTPLTNGQAYVDVSVSPDTKTPLHFRGPWETSAYQQLLQNALAWGTGVEG